MLLSLKTFLVGVILTIGSIFGIHSTISDNSVGSIINPPDSTSSSSSVSTSTFGFITATTTSATSTFAGNLSVSGNTSLSSLVSNTGLIGSSANFTRFPNALSAISNIASGIQQNESHNIGLIAEGLASSTNSNIYGIGIYGAGYTNGATRSSGVTGEGHSSSTADTGSAVGVRGYAHDTHASGMNIGLYTSAKNSSIGNYGLYFESGNIYASTSINWTQGNGGLSIGTTTAATYGFEVATTTQFLGDVIARTVAYTASTSVTINTANTDIATITVAHATTTFNAPSGTLYNGKMFEIMLTATTTRGLAWATGTGAFASSTDLSIPITTASGTAKYIYEYRSQSGRWELNGLVTGFQN